MATGIWQPLWHSPGFGLVFTRCRLRAICRLWAFYRLWAFLPPLGHLSLSILPPSGFLLPSGLLTPLGLCLAASKATIKLYCYKNNSRNLVYKIIKHKVLNHTPTTTTATAEANDLDNHNITLFARTIFLQHSSMTLNIIHILTCTHTYIPDYNIHSLATLNSMHVTRSHNLFQTKTKLSDHLIATTTTSKTDNRSYWIHSCHSTTTLFTSSLQVNINIASVILLAFCSILPPVSTAVYIQTSIIFNLIFCAAQQALILTTGERKYFKKNVILHSLH